MNRMKRSFVSRLLLICVVCFMIAGCWCKVWKKTFIFHLPWSDLLIVQVEVWVRVAGSDDECRALRGVKIPVEWDIAVADTFEIEGDLIPIHRDSGVEAELNDSFPPEPGYKWVGFSTDDPVNSALYPDTVTTRFVYQIDRNLPSGPEAAMVYEKSGEDCQHRWGADAQFIARVPDIPTLTEWGMIIFGAVLLGFITWVFLRKRRVVAVS